MLCHGCLHYISTTIKSLERGGNNEHSSIEYYHLDSRCNCVCDLRSPNKERQGSKKEETGKTGT